MKGEAQRAEEKAAVRLTSVSAALAESFTEPCLRTPSSVQFWFLHLKNDIAKVEPVQKRTTKMLKGGRYIVPLAQG